MSFTEQISAAWAIVLLIDFLFGITFGVVGGAVHGSRRGALLVPAADDLRSAGARVIHGVWTRGYPRGPRSVNDHASGEPHRQEVDR
jgi:hypothetical protein